MISMCGIGLRLFGGESAMHRKFPARFGVKVNGISEASIESIIFGKMVTHRQLDSTLRILHRLNFVEFVC